MFEVCIQSYIDRLVAEIDSMKAIIIDAKRTHHVRPALSLTYLRESSQGISAARRRELEGKLRSVVPAEVEDIDVAFQAASQALLADTKYSQFATPEDKKTYPISAGQQYVAFSYVMESSTLARDLRNALEDVQSIEELAYVQSYMSRAYRVPDSSLLGRSFLPLIVSDFEDFLADLIRVGLLLHPLGFGPPPEIPGDMVQEYGGMEDLRRYQIDKSTRDLVSETPQRWKRKLSNWPGVHLDALCYDWDAFIELINRRNVVVHNGGIVDQKYIDNLPGSRPKPSLGSRIGAGSEYICAGLDLVKNLTLCLGYAWIGKLSKKSKPNKCNLYIVEYLWAREWRQALKLAETCLPLLDGDDKWIVRVNAWMSRQEMGDNDGVRAELEAAQLPSNERFAAAEAALRMDGTRLLKIVRSVPDTKGFTSELRTWPLIHRLCAEDTAVQKDFKVAGEGGRKKRHKRRKKRQRR